MDSLNKKYQESLNQQAIRVKIEKIEKDQIRLITEDRQRIWWSKKKIPKNTLVNKDASLYLVLKTNLSDKKERQKLAKAILQEVLNVNNYD